MKSLYILLLIPFLISRLIDPNESNTTEVLVWSDEFEYEGSPDLEKWTSVDGNGCPELCGFGNNEMQYYSSTSNNIEVKDGRLIIKALHHPEEEYPYTSAKIVSRNKGDWTYGTIKVRAKLPEGRGTWAAIWMMPTMDSRPRWPHDGEIDIMEYVGFHESWVHGAVHTKANNGMNQTQIVDSVYVNEPSETFHIYELDWGPDKIAWKIDGKVFNEYFRDGDDPNKWPFDKPFHLIFNLAVGGNWGGMHGIDNDIWPQQFEIDYVRVYK